MTFKRHLEKLADREVSVSGEWSANDAAGSDCASVGADERLARRGIGEQARNTILVVNDSRRGVRHCRARLQDRERGVEVVHAEHTVVVERDRRTRAEVHQGCDLPATDYAVQETVQVATELLGTAEGQLKDAVGGDVVTNVEIRWSTEGLRVESILNGAPVRLRCRGVIKCVRPCVIEV